MSASYAEKYDKSSLFDYNLEIVCQMSNLVSRKIWEREILWANLSILCISLWKFIAGEYSFFGIVRLIVSATFGYFGSIPR